MSWHEKDLVCRVGALYQSHQDDAIWAGMGGTLIRVPRSDCRPLRVFLDTYIHRIQSSLTPNEIWVYGGKRLAVIDTFHHRVQHQIQAPDWIQHVWSSSKNSNLLWLLTSHNRVHRVSIESGQVQSTWVCEERCILYSGLLVPSEGAEPAVLSGTVFQTILVWQPQDPSPVLHRLTGHEGVIFGLDFHAERNLICSTSDDRTARVWRIIFKDKDRDWQRCQIQALWVFSGHTARVFRSLILSNGIVVGGEDSRLTFWRQGQCFRSEAQGHNGSPVWALAAHSNKANVVISGGQDGSIRRWSLDPDPVAIELSMPSFNARDFYPRVVREFEGWIICIVGRNGIVALRWLGPAQNDVQTLTLVDETPDQVTFCALEVFKNSMFAATNCGRLKEYRLERDSECEALKCVFVTSTIVFDAKVFSLQIVWFDNDSLILVCGPNGMVKGVHRRTSSVYFFELPQPKPSKTEQGQWVNCAVIQETLGLLVLGDRHGNILSYLLNDPCRFEAVLDVDSDFASWKVCFVDQNGIIPKAHQQRGVSHLSIGQNLNRLTSIGRDGLMKTYDIDEVTQSIAEKSCTRLPLDSLEMIIGTKFVRNGDNINQELILGFHGSDFVLYSLKEHRVLARIPCGGSHRSWSFVTNGNQSKFAFVKDRKLFVVIVKLDDILSSCLKEGFHSREIQVVRHFELDHEDYLATAGEDVDIRIHKISSQGEFSTERVLKSHISSIKAIDVVKLDTQSQLLVSVGGRAQIKVWLATPGLTITETASHLLKGNDKRRKKTWRDSNVIHDTETRFTDVAIDPRNNTSIFVGGSDCVLRKFELSDNFSRVDLVAESEPLHHAFLSLKVDPQLGLVITTSNDGFVRIFTTEELTLVNERMLTKSGLNVISKPCQGQMCFAGGDGGEIVWFDYPSLTKHHVFPECQAAQINGMHFLAEKNELITSSVDQRISLWSILCDSNSDAPTLQLKSQICTDVADAQCLDVWPSGEKDSYLVAIGGEGMAIFEFK